MKGAGFICGVALSLSTVGASLGAKAPLITASGEIPLHIRLLRADPAESPIALTLVHRLVNVGSKYISNIGVAELESRLVPEEQGRYLWVSPSGQAYKARLGDAFATGGGIAVMGIMGGTMFVRSGSRQLIYRSGVLAEVRDGPTVTQYDCVQGRVNSVSGGGVRLEMVSRGESCAIKSTDGLILLRLNEWGSVVRCEVDRPGIRELYRFKYADALLTEVRSGEETLAIKMGAGDWSGDFSLDGVYHPVVRTIGDMAVRIRRDLRVIDGTASRGGKPLVSWRAIREGGEFRVVKVTGEAELLLADVDAYVIDG